jgi:hypothetical protein
VRDKSKFDKKNIWFKENDSEIDFEEEPGSSLISTKQNNEERYQEHEDNYLLQKPSRKKKRYV